MRTSKIKSIKNIGVQKTLDLEVNHTDHNFYAEGLITSNSHAASYSYLAALTIYLKYKHPQEFFVECLNMAANKTKPQEIVAQIQRELSDFGIKLLPPDLIKSKSKCTIEGNDIRFGFILIKGLSNKTIEPMEAFLSKDRRDKFSVFNAARESKLNLGVLCSLIQAGMLSSAGDDRERLVYEAQIWNLLTDREQAWCLENGDAYDYNTIYMVKNIKDWVDEKGKPVARKTRFGTIKKNSQRYKEIYQQNKKYPTFASWWYETTLLGYAYSTKLKNVFLKSRPTLMSMSEISDCSERSNVEAVARVEEVKRGISKKGNKYIRMLLADEDGAYPAMIVGDKMEEYSRKNPTPKEGNIVFFTGQKGSEIVWINKMSIQDQKVFMKLSDIK